MTKKILDYWDDGKLASSQTFEGENLHGESRFYRQNGTLEIIQQWHHGKAHGEWVYHTDQETIDVLVYEDDCLVDYRVNFIGKGNKR